MRKGFTLIEILGVIILLGIIALITFAVITGLIKNTKEKAFEDSILNTEEAAYNFLASKVLYENATNDTCYIFNYGNDVSEITFIESKDGKDYYQAPISSMSVKNDNFTEGSITVCNNSIVSTLSNGEYTYKDKGIIDGGLAENDLTEPIINSVIYNNTSKSITVSVNANEEDYGKIKNYYYSLDGDNYIEASSNAYTFSSLKSDTEYTVYVKVSNESLMETLYNSKTTTVEITAPTYNVSPSGYATSKVLSIDYPVGYTKEYSLDGGTTWLVYSTALIFNNNGSVIARASDGTNYVTGSSYTISNIDTTLPTVISSVISGATATISLGDNLLLSGYTVTNSATVPTTWTTISGNSISRDYTATSAGTYYAWVKDAAGNTKYSILIIPASAFAYNATLLTYGATSSNSSYGASCERHCDCPHARGSGAGHCNYDVSVGLSVSWWCSYSCPSGGYLSGSNCITTSYSCPSGGTLSGTTCSTYTCPRGGTLNGTTCVFN